MLSMSKLLTSIILASSLLLSSAYAQSQDTQTKQVLSFLKNRISHNPNISDLSIQIVGHKVLSHPKGWTAYMVAFHAKAKVRGQEKTVTQRSVYFAKNGYLTTQFISLKNGEKINYLITPKFKHSYYTKSNLLYGNADAKYKVAIFSDPLCPFCREFVPPALRYMSKYPKTFAVYYYNFPLALLHPASPTIVKAAIYLELRGDKSIILRLYGLKMNIDQTNQQKILDEFNKQLGVHVTLQDIGSVMVKDALKHDEHLGAKLMVRGTPTFFFNGVMDPTKNKYKEVKVIK